VRPYTVPGGRMKVNEEDSSGGVDWALCPPNRGEIDAHVTKDPVT